MKIECRVVDGQLPLVAEIGLENAVTRLEGDNGIGKTITSEVLTICCGQQPLRGDRQRARWTSLRDLLGSVEITITQLAGGQSVAWRFDSRTWPQDLATARDVTDEWFTGISIDGHSASLSDVRQLVSAYRLAGNEGLVETLVEECEQAAQQADVFRDATEARRSLLGAEIGKLRRLLNSVNVDQLGELMHRDVELKLELQEQQQQDRTLVDQLKLADAALAAAARLRDLTSDADIQAEIDSIVQRRSDVRSERDKLQEKVDELVVEGSRQEEAREKLERSEQSVKRATTQLTNAAGRLGRSLQSAGLQGAEDIDPERQSVRDELERARRARRDISLAEPLIELGTRLLDHLEDASGQGLGDETIAIDADAETRELTVRRLADDVDRRREQLAVTPDDPALEEISQRVTELDQRLQQLNEARSLAEKRNTAATRLQTARERHQKVSEELDPAAAERLRQTREQLSAYDDELAKLMQRQTLLEQQQADLESGPPIESVRAELGAALASLSTTTGELERLHLQLSRTRSGHQAQLETTREQVAAVRRERSKLLRELERLIADLWDNDVVDSLAARLPELRPESNAETGEQLRRLARLDQLVQRVEDEIDVFENQVIAIPDLLRGLGGQVRGRLTGRTDASATAARDRDPYLDIAKLWLSRIAEGWFAVDTVREQLLGPDAATVTVDIDDRQVTAVDADGQIVAQRNLDSYSSGEQAFAFTRARLALIDHQASQPGRQRLVILDEFGAFVAQNLRAPLNEFLADWTGQHPRDRILMILPASEDYGALVHETIGQLHDRYTERLRQLDERRYFLESWSE
ncbi:hypothetical protein [Baekduia sp. Peel2402]|uniref:hypothetical protein n=1 Tax=Baekduia sp. Peel2402 TaxID=3458296 RepID=UPI00403E6502